MNVSTSVIFSDMKERDDLPDNVRSFLEELTRRLDVALGEILSGLKNEPTILTVDPDDEANAEAIEGTKDGDVAIYRDGAGAIQVALFD